MKLKKRIIEVVENNGFIMDNVEKQGNNFYVSIYQYTPLGEDWGEVIWFDGTNKGFIEAVRDSYNSFDVDEEAEIWVECRGKNGVPNSIRALVEDAEWKEAALGKLADELEELL